LCEIKVMFGFMASEKHVETRVKCSGRFMYNAQISKHIVTLNFRPETRLLKIT